MQYILTEEEYKNLVPGNKVAELEGIIDELNGLVLKYSKYHCIYERGGGFGCCDNCPITFSCTKYKRYTK